MRAQRGDAVQVVIDGGVVWRTDGGERHKVGSVYPTVHGWQSCGRMFASRFCRTQHAAVRELLADNGIHPALAPR